MDVLFLQLAWVIRVPFSRKSNQPIVVHVNSQGIEAGDEHIDTQVVLETIQ